MHSGTIEFIKYLTGLRSAKTSDTENELNFLSKLAVGKECIVEVGVYEGVASSFFCQSMSTDGKLYLIDPYFHDLKIEKILNFSTTEYIAKQTVKPWKSQVEFVRMTSVEASRLLTLYGKADLIFIDARHDYESVLEDFNCWSPMLAKNGLIAFHDSCVCSARPDLSNTVGPVKLCREIASGKHGNWKAIATVDSITVFSVGQ
jgi:predicted O-methyltransferase YrrM